MRGRAAGLTLIELLIALALIGIILAVVTSWQASTLAAATRSNAASQSLLELNDVTAYVGDRVRSAIAVRTGSFTINAASATNSGLCDLTTPCLAVLVPEEVASASASGPPFTYTYARNYLQLVYRIEPRSSWSAADKDKVPNTWADTQANKVVILREYRLRCAVTSTNDCSTFISGFSGGTFSGFNPALVADYLTSEDKAGTAITPFAYSATTKTVTLKFQNKQQVRGKTYFTPATPYTLDVQARNVSP